MNKLVLLMTDKRMHIKTINEAINDKKLKNINLVGSLTNNKNTYNYLKKNFSDCSNNLINKNSNRELFENNIIEKLGENKPNILLLTGWKFIFGNKFINNFDKVINIHPALPNSYIGLNCIEKALIDNKKGIIKDTGVMIHYVTENLDRGEVINYKNIPIYQDDDLVKLTNRFRVYEKNLIIESLNKIC